MDQASYKLSKHILLALVLGLIIGIMLNILPKHHLINDYVILGVLDIGGKIFLTLLKMIVMPVVFVSLVCGVGNLGDSGKLGRMAGLTIILYLLTTAVAITLAICFAKLFNIGVGSHYTVTHAFQAVNAPSLKQVLLDIFPSNVLSALAKGNMLQIIFFALMLGLAINKSGSAGKRIRDLFDDMNHVVMCLINIIMAIAPYGVFCLVTKVFAQTGAGLILQLLSYFSTVALVLILQLLLTYNVLLISFTGINPLQFFKRLIPAMLFAFSTSSSSASIPVVLRTVEEEIGVAPRIAAFCIPLGATINMDGTAIMQGVATVFIAHLSGIALGLTGYLTVILMATLASIGTAGVPGVGLITLAMVLRQVGLPIETIGLILGVDRLLDMLRTAVNISGDCVVATIVARSQNALDFKK